MQAASKIKLGLDENVEATFKMSQSLYLNRPKAPCTEKANYSLTACLLDYVEHKACKKIKIISISPFSSKKSFLFIDYVLRNLSRTIVIDAGAV